MRADLPRNVVGFHPSRPKRYAAHNHDGRAKEDAEQERFAKYSRLAVFMNGDQSSEKNSVAAEPS